MALTATKPPGWNANQDYTYTGADGVTYYGRTGDGSTLPTPAGFTPNPNAVGTGAIVNPSGTAPGGGASTASQGGLGALIDAAAYGNTQAFELEKQKVEAAIENANRQYQLARNADERASALFELQKWQAELNRVTKQQDQYTDLAKTLLQAAVEKSSRPNDYFQYNKLVSGGRDIFNQVSGGAPAAFSAPAGRFEPGDITDILSRLGVPAYPQTTPLGGTGAAPGAPAAGQQPSSAVSQAQADAVADGLGIDRRFLYEYVAERKSLPDLSGLQQWMTAKGYRGQDGRMTGKVPGVGWQGGASAAGDARPPQQSQMAAPGGGSGGTTAVAAPPPPAQPQGNAWDWARQFVPRDIAALGKEYEDYFAEAIALGRGGGGVAEGFYNATGEQENQNNGAWD